MKKKFRIISGIIICLIVITLSACGNEYDSLLEIENRAENYENIEKELKDLKTIKLKYVEPKMYEKLSKVIYDNYFQGKKDKKNQKIEKDEYGTSINYETKKIYEVLDTGNFYITYDIINLETEDEKHGETKNEVIEAETKKLFKLMGLEYNTDNGYFIDKIIKQENNQMDVFCKRKIEGKNISLIQKTGYDDNDVESVEINFIDNKIASFSFRDLTELVDIKPYRGEVLIDKPIKAHKIVDDYIRSTSGAARITENGVHDINISQRKLEKADIAYCISKINKNEITMKPIEEFYDGNDSGTIYYVDLETKEAGEAVCC